MKVFLSYLIEYKNIAAKIKRILDDFGFQSFLAHEDIQPTQDWIKTILEYLNKTQVFLPILTRNFQKSEWVNQEIGYALAKNKLIIPMKIDIDPPGFLLKFQALKYNPHKRFPLSRMLQVIGKNQKSGGKLRDLLIEKFGQSGSWAEAGMNTQYLLSVNNYSEEQVLRIIEKTMSNDQIYYSFRARPLLLNFVKNQSYKLDKRLLKEFEKKLSKY